VLCAHHWHYCLPEIATHAHSVRRLLLNEKFRQDTTFDADPTLRQGEAFASMPQSISVRACARVCVCVRVRGVLFPHPVALCEMLRATSRWILLFLLPGPLACSPRAHLLCACSFSV
jgi:hypothetical protein